MVYTPPAGSVAPDAVTYGVGYDFGFRGGGDVQSPFGFTMDGMGRYRYTPMTAMLYPGVIPDFTDITGQRKKPLSLGDGIAPELIKGLLSIFVGGKENAEKAWAPIGYFTKVSPESMFFLKIITLLNSAQKNTKVAGAANATGKYPSLSDVPFELMCLMFRLVFSPDIDATVKLNEGFGPDKSFRWERVVTLSRPSKLLAKFPKFFVTLLESFKPAIDAREIQEYKDRFGAPVSELQQLYSASRSQHPYENRIDYIKTNVVDKVDTKTLNPTDLDLFNYIIRQAVSERFRGLQTFILSTVIGSNVIVDSEGNSDRTVEDGVVDDPRLISIDVTRMTDFLGKRVPKIKDFITYLLSDAKKSLLSDDLASYLIAIEGSIDKEFADLQQMAVDLTDARKALADAHDAQGGSFVDSDPTRLLEQKVSQRIVDKLQAIEEGESGELQAPTGKKISVPLPVYLDIKFWQVMRTMQQPFVGDKNFMVNDARLSLPKGLMHAYAICFRANLDLSYIENLVKTDARSFVIKDPLGNPITVSGQQIYKDYTDAERYVMYCDQKVAAYRASLGKLSPQQVLKDPEFTRLSKDSDNAAILFGKARAAFRNALRQFEVDRRLPRAKQVGFVLMGETSMEGLGDVNVLQVAPAQATPATASTTATTSGGTPATTPAATPSTTPARPVADDPLAAFDLSGTGETLDDYSSEDGTAPSLDDPFSALGGVTPVLSAQQKFLNLPPEKYDYARTVNLFLRQEFARLMLRCPALKDVAQKNLDGAVYQLTGMRVNELLQKTAGEESDILKQDDQAYLPEGNFFSEKLSGKAIGSGTSSLDMDALGKELAAKYGVEPAADDLVDEVGPGAEGGVSQVSSAQSSQEAMSIDSGAISAEEQKALDAEAAAAAQDRSNGQGSQDAVAADSGVQDGFAPQESVPSDGQPLQEVADQNSQPPQDAQAVDQGLNQQVDPLQDTSAMDQQMMDEMAAEAAAAAQTSGSPQPADQFSQNNQQLQEEQSFSGQ